MNKYLRHDKLDKNINDKLHNSFGNIKYHISHEMFVVPWQIEEQEDKKPVNKQK
jgi:hypothetical protein